MQHRPIDLTAFIDVVRGRQASAHRSNCIYRDRAGSSRVSASAHRSNCIYRDRAGLSNIGPTIKLHLSISCGVVHRTNDQTAFINIVRGRLEEQHRASVKLHLSISCGVVAAGSAHRFKLRLSISCGVVASCSIGPSFKLRLSLSCGAVARCSISRGAPSASCLNRFHRDRAGSSRGALRFASHAASLCLALCRPPSLRSPGKFQRLSCLCLLALRLNVQSH